MYFDLFQDCLLTRRHPLYQELHAHGSVLRGSAPMPEFGECWYIIGYKEALTVLRSDEFIHDRSKVSGSSPLSSFSGSAREFWGALVEWPLFMDPPQHTSKRLSLAHFFKEQSVLSLERFIEEECNSLLDRALTGPEFDLMWDFAYPLTLAVTCKVIGIKMPDTVWFKQLARTLADAMDFHAGEHEYKPAIHAVEELQRYLANEITTASKGTLCASLAEQGMSIPEQTSLLMQLLFAGQETSADAIGNLMLAMDHRRDLWLKVKNDNSLASLICKESLRYDTSLQFSGIRTAAQDAILGKQNIKKGDALIIASGACNQDPHYFDSPTIFKHERDTSGPELTFGHGIHYCLGVHLARLELQIALKCMTKRLPLSWHIHETVMRKNIVFHGPTILRMSAS